MTNNTPERDQQTRPLLVPVTLLTGFLGAGKTTFINKLLLDPTIGKTVIIVNEFGEIGIDHDLIVSTDENMVVISSGCVCCTVRDDLVSALEDLLRRRDNNRIVPFERIVIETTGLADPAPILHTIMGHKYLSMRYSLEGVVTVIDAVNGFETLELHEEAIKQAAVADRLWVSKTDLVSSEQYKPLITRLKRLNPSAKIVSNGDENYSAISILDCGLYNPDNKLPDVRRWLNEEALMELNNAHEGHDHAVLMGDTDQKLKPDYNYHSTEIIAFCFTSFVPITQQAYEIFVELLKAVHGSKLLRVKGIVYLEDKAETPLIVQGAQHVFHKARFLEKWPTDIKETKLVFIVQNLEKKVIEKIWEALIKQV